MNRNTRRNGRPANSKVTHERLWLSQIKPSPENDELYRPINDEDPSLINLSESIRERGVLEPLVLTQDRYILSGHRRFAAAKLAGKRKVPVRYENVKCGSNEFFQLLPEYNRQRVKGIEETIHEEFISADSDDPRTQLLDHRRRKSLIAVSPVDLGPAKRRKKISSAKNEMVDAILRTFDERAAYLPLTVRSVHYALLNYPPLIHASKPESRYLNNMRSYNSLVELLTRMRVDGVVPMDWVDDETRPITTWKVYDSPADFIQGQIDGFLKGFYRNLLKSQPHHYELLGEKNTVNVVLQRVAAKYRIPLTSGRGYASLPPRHKMAERYRASGKDKLVLLVVSDFDPDGEEICRSFGRSMRDDFGIDAIRTIKLALTREQTEGFDLPAALDAKINSPQYKKFLGKYGSDSVWELEAMPPDLLEKTVSEGIEAVIDSDLLDDELRAECEDQNRLSEIRDKVHVMMKSADLSANE